MWRNNGGVTSNIQRHLIGYHKDEVPADELYPEPALPLGGKTGSSHPIDQEVLVEKLVTWIVDDDQVSGLFVPTD